MLDALLKSWALKYVIYFTTKVKVNKNFSMRRVRVYILYVDFAQVHPEMRLVSPSPSKTVISRLLCTAIGFVIQPESIIEDPLWSN